MPMAFAMSIMAIGGELQPLMPWDARARLDEGMQMHYL